MKDVDSTQKSAHFMTRKERSWDQLGQYMNGTLALSYTRAWNSFWLRAARSGKPWVKWTFLIHDLTPSPAALFLNSLL